MSSIRNSRTRLIGAATTVALAALSLTACGDKAATDNSAGTRPSTPAAPTTSAPAQATPTAAPSSPPSTAAATKPAPPAHTKRSADPVGDKAPDSGSKAVTCEGSNTKVVASPVQRPLNHLLLTVTNTGSRTCYLYGYPALRFSDAQAVPPVVADSHPQAVVTLNPGESGYASVALSAGDGSGTNGRTVKSLTVYFQGRSGNASVGAAARPPLPAKGVHIDDSLTTTYWQQSMDDALTW